MERRAHVMHYHMHQVVPLFLELSKVLEVHLQLALAALEFEVGNDACPDLFDLKGFCYIIHSTGGKCLHFVYRFVERTDENHGNSGQAFILFQHPADLITVHFRHHNVQKDEVRLEPADDVQCGAAVHRHGDFTDVVESVHKHIHVVSVVIDDQNAVLG